VEKVANNYTSQQLKGVAGLGFQTAIAFAIAKELPRLAALWLCGILVELCFKRKLAVSSDVIVWDSEL